MTIQPLTTQELETACHELDASLNKIAVGPLQTRNNWHYCHFYVMWLGKAVKIQLEVEKTTARNLSIRADREFLLTEWEKIVKDITNKQLKPVIEIIYTLEQKINSYGKPTS